MSASGDSFDFSNPRSVTDGSTLVDVEVLEKNTDTSEFKFSPEFERVEPRPYRFVSRSRSWKQALVTFSLLLFIVSLGGYLYTEYKHGKSLAFFQPVFDWLGVKPDVSPSNSVSGITQPIKSVFNGNGFSIVTSSPIPSSFIVGSETKSSSGSLGASVITSLLESSGANVQSGLLIEVREAVDTLDKQSFSNFATEQLGTTAFSVDESKSNQLSASVTFTNRMVRIIQTNTYVYIITQLEGDTPNKAYVSEMVRGLVLN